MRSSAGVDLHATLHQQVELLRANPVRCTPLFALQLLYNGLLGGFPDVDGVVDHAVLVVEPEDAVIGLGVNAIQSGFLEELVHTHVLLFVS